ncbi:hypothetical protein [Helicobacter mesocricetorum]|uniref:hypothetical protein n=1 Tax=Helicobacter mesocricetorum TaxID=87012 RepID=UPI000CF074F4|nr:hypothetical protein [Helicobacter mesocricetorum]
MGNFLPLTKSNQKIVDRIIALVDEILAIKANCHSEPALVGEESLGKELRSFNRDISDKPSHNPQRFCPHLQTGQK